MTREHFTLVSFHAHPDDESFLTGGTLARAAAEGHRVVVVTATDGERGLASAADGTGETLAALRRRELEAAAAALGCARVVRLGYRDSGLGSDPNAESFANADVDEVSKRLASILVAEQADALTVYDPRGGYGHPDHVQVHRTGTRAASLAGTPLVLEATLDGDLVDTALRVLRLVRSPLRRAAPLQGRHLFTPRRLLTHRVDVSAHLAAKRLAMSAHASQQRADGQVRMLTRFLRLPPPVFRAAFRREWFVEQGRRPGPLEDDIFASLRGTRAQREQRPDGARQSSALARSSLVRDPQGYEPRMQNILVTGTSSGIGEATALHLAELGMRVFAAVRDPRDGDALRARASANGSIEPVFLDVRDESSIRQAVDQIRATVGPEGLAGLVNDAGEGFPGPLEIIELAQLREQLEVNVVGQVAVTQAALPMVRQARGRIIFVGSIGGKVAVQFAGPYHASKYAIEAIGDCLRQELEPDGIAVSIVEPGPISTGIWQKAEARIDDLLTRSPQVDRYRERLLKVRNNLQSADEKGASPSDVAAVIAKALTASRPAARYPVGAPAKLTAALKPWIPDKLYDAVARRAV